MPRGGVSLAERPDGAAYMFASLSGECRTLWAKSGEPNGHSLICHMLDVAAVISVMLDHCGCNESELARWFGLPPEEVKRWLCASGGLHDLGKAIPGFQAKWLPGRQLLEQAGLVFSPDKALQQDRHDLATAALLPDYLKERGVPYFWAAGISQAVSAHHGFNFLPGQAKAPLREADSWKKVRQELFDAYWDTLGASATPDDLDLPLPAIQWLAGLVAVCDWIGSNSDWFPPGERGGSLAAHFVAARTIAAEVLADRGKLGWPSLKVLLDTPGADTDALLARIVSSAGDIKARPLQCVADHLLAGGAGPTLMVVEAPMGEGKTELAFLASLRLQAREHHRGIYIALPTQATGNAMFERALKFLQAFAGDAVLDMQLVHGGAQMNQTVARLRDIWGASRDESVQSSAWFTQKRRGLLSPYGVGTVDQGLFGVMNVKHHFVRLWGLANKIVILDEVHAYDTYTTGLIEVLLRWLKSFGCSVVLMSATLPNEKRAALLQAWGVQMDIPDVPYPRVVVADDRGVRGETFPARSQEPVHVHGLDESLESLVAQALASLQEGGCGAVILNTVDRAQKLHDLITDRMPPGTVLHVFHARFPADQRQQIEAAVLGTFGAPGGAVSRPERALLIATQVAEQSLDIDFDFLITDLAPVDLLLQRAGRLHRHVREYRPGAHAVPRLYVSGLLPDRLPDLETTRWGRIYGDYLCLVTWFRLLQEPVWRLPSDIDRLVQSVYAPWPDLSGLAPERARQIEEVSRTEHRVRAEQYALLARHIAIDPRETPEYAYLDKPHGADEDDTLALRNETRLGSDSVTVIPVHLDASGSWQLHPGEGSLDPSVPVNDAMARQLYGRQLKVSRMALIKYLKAQPSWPALSEHPLLSHFYPLILQGGQCRIGQLCVRLDPKLGLVYSTETPQEVS